MAAFDVGLLFLLKIRLLFLSVSVRNPHAQCFVIKLSLMLFNNWSKQQCLFIWLVFFWTFVNMSVTSTCKTGFFFRSRMVQAKELKVVQHLHNMSNKQTNESYFTLIYRLHKYAHEVMVQCRHYFVYKWHFCAGFGMGNCKNASYNSSAKLCAA